MLRSASLRPLSLQLVKESDVLIKLYEAKERDELAHYALLEVYLHSKGALDEIRAEHLHLLLSKLIVIRHLYRQWILVRIVVQINESVVQEESRVALLAVGVIDLLTTRNVFESLNNETSSVICVGPARLSRPFVVKHISVRNKAVCLDTFDLDAEYATGHHHANLRVLLK